MIAPIFLFSLPRSGSTLVQRLLASSQHIATASEPWLLLPLLYTLKERGCHAEYGHKKLVAAISDFVTTLPNGNADYLAELRELVLRVYAKAAGEGARYFLDKTPPYHLVAEEIVGMFPGAKFICLWRNPLAVIASIIETWCGGKWSLHRHEIDVFDGLCSLVSVCQRHGARIFKLRYEDLLANPSGELRKVFGHLDLPFSEDALTRFKDVRLDGRMGDRSGRARYQTLSSDPLAKWKLTLSNPVRKAWCRRYLQWVGEERLAVMGYRLGQLLEELALIPSTPRVLAMMGNDVARVGYGILYSAAEPRLARRGLAALPGWHRERARI